MGVALNRDLVKVRRLRHQVPACLQLLSSADQLAQTGSWLAVLSLLQGLPALSSPALRRTCALLAPTRWLGQQSS